MRKGAESSTSRRMRAGGEFRLHCFQQFVEVRIDDLPNKLEVQARIHVCGYVPKAEDLTPWNFWMALTQCLWEMVPSSVGDGLEPPRHHVLKHLVEQELVESRRLVAPNTKNAVTDVSQVPLFAVSQWVRNQPLSTLQPVFRH